jgi:hypothetical protein
LPVQARHPVEWQIGWVRCLELAETKLVRARVRVGVLEPSVREAAMLEHHDVK